MRHLINGTLAFTLIAFIGGVVPVSAQYLAHLKAVKTELAAVQSQRLVHLRASLSH